jgi:hypothetical protein
MLLFKFKYYFLVLLYIPFVAQAQQITDSIPFRYEKGSLLVDAKIDGKPCTLLFDTGCSTTDFTGAFASALGWDYPKEKERVGKIEIGTYTAELTLTAKAKAPFNCPSFSTGHIGYDLMKDKIWMIDYRKEKIYILNKLPEIPESTGIIPFQIRQNQLWASAAINKGEKQDLKLDTGFSSISKKAMMVGERWLNADSSELDTLCYERTCGGELCRKITMLNLSFGDKQDFYVESLVSKAPNVPVLGNGFFDQYRPIFDLKNNKLILFPKE